MKKIQFSSLLVVIVYTAIFFGCNKSDQVSSELFNKDNQKQNEVTWFDPVENNVKGWAWWVKLRIFIGHTSADCGNSCMKVFGEYTHVDCRGYGSVCEALRDAIIAEGDNPGEYTLTFVDNDALCEDLEYQFPDRSLFVTNPQRSNELWMNIPEQKLIRTNVDEPFILKLIWFSELQELENP